MNEEARDADLVVLEGMGRAIETNLNARLRCDALKIGMIKHREVRRPPLPATEFGCDLRQRTVRICACS